MSHTDWKQKKSKIEHRERLYNANTLIMARRIPSESIKENFYRPAYGKIGERRKEEC